METTYYTLTAREIIISGDGVEQASGGGARQLLFRPRTAVRPMSVRPGKVIDLERWKMNRAEDVQEVCGEADRQPEPHEAMPQDHWNYGRAVLLGGELLASLSVAGVMLLLLARILGS